MTRSKSTQVETTIQDQVVAYRESLRTLSPQTVWHTLNLATVLSPGDVPDGMEWRIPIMRLHLIVLEHGGEWFIEDPATMGLDGAERDRWWEHSARRHIRMIERPMESLRESLGRTYYGDDEYDRMRDAGQLPSGLMGPCDG